MDTTGCFCFGTGLTPRLLHRTQHATRLYPHSTVSAPRVILRLAREGKRDKEIAVMLTAQGPFCLARTRTKKHGLSMKCRRNTGFLDVVAILENDRVTGTGFELSVRFRGRTYILSAAGDSRGDFFGESCCVRRLLLTYVPPLSVAALWPNKPIR